jgi:DNA-binding response OmpR family regulator
MDSGIEPMTGTDADTTVLVVDDDEDLADTYAQWLDRSDYDALTAYDGDEALARLGPEVDVLLLDRRMPRISGDRVLERARERPGEHQVSMLTAVEPEPDILDLPFDEYVTKPVDRAELVDVVERLVTRQTLDTDLQELFRLASKLGALKTGTGHDVEQARAELEARMEAKQDRVDEMLQQLDDEEAMAILQKPGAAPRN